MTAICTASSSVGEIASGRRARFMLEIVRDDIAKSLLKGKTPSTKPCRDMSISPRALRDRLKQFAKTFRRSLDEVRRDLVREHLLAACRSPSAYLLGFSEPLHFSMHARLVQTIGREVSNVAIKLKHRTGSRSLP